MNPLPMLLSAHLESAITTSQCLVSRYFATLCRGRTVTISDSELSKSTLFNGVPCQSWTHTEAALLPMNSGIQLSIIITRSEERRVGTECRCGGALGRWRERARDR